MCRISWKSGNLDLLEPSGPQRAYYGTALPLDFIYQKLLAIPFLVSLPHALTGTTYTHCVARNSKLISWVYLLIAPVTREHSLRHLPSVKSGHSLSYQQREEETTDVFGAKTLLSQFMNLCQSIRNYFWKLALKCAHKLMHVHGTTLFQKSWILFQIK
jgi:hypothetical protein